MAVLLKNTMYIAVVQRYALQQQTLMRCTITNAFLNNAITKTINNSYNIMYCVCVCVHDSEKVGQCSSLNLMQKCGDCGAVSGFELGAIIVGA